MPDEQRPARPTRQTAENYVPEVFDIRLQDLLVLYVNLCNAAKHKQIGYVNSEESFQDTWSLLQKKTIALKHEELEALLWCCVHLDELPDGSRFWHPNGKSVDAFINQMLHYKKVRFYFDKIYNFFRRRKPKKGTPKEFIVTIGDEDGDDSV